MNNKLSKIKEIIHKSLKSLIPGILLSITTCFMLFIFAPLELYFTNQDEFWFDMYTLLSVICITFAVCTLISILILSMLCFFSQKTYFILIAVYFIIFISTYIQGNFLIENLPPMDGSPINWNQYPLERIKSLALWITITLLVIIMFHKLKKAKFLNIIKAVSIFMLLMLNITLISLCISTKGYQVKRDLSVSTKNILKMSENKNFIILLLDAVDARALSDLFNKNPDYAEIFTDFAYYPDTMGAYSYTKHSIPYILSGDWYENDEPFQEYITNVYANSTLFSDLEQSDYQIGLYDADLPLDDDCYYRFENILPNLRGVNSFVTFARWQIQLTGFKYAPFDLKRICFVNPTAFNTLKNAPEGYSVFTWSNLAFYNTLLEDKITLTKDNCFKFIHLEGGHVPFQYDKNLNIIKDGTYEDNLEACLTITDTYLKKLKTSGVYDNSVIIIMADHGYNGDNIEGRQNPILFIKGIHEQHTPHTSNTPVSFSDLQKAYTELLEGKNTAELFSAYENSKRERRFLLYDYFDDSIMTEYIQRGVANDLSTLTPTGNKYILTQQRR